MPWLMVWDSLFCPTHRKYYSLKEKQRGLYLTKILGGGNEHFFSLMAYFLILLSSEPVFTSFSFESFAQERTYGKATIEIT